MNCGANSTYFSGKPILEHVRRLHHVIVDAD
jgi:hypothetical protein